MRALSFLRWITVSGVVACAAVARAADPAGIGDLQVRSTPDATEIQVAVPLAIEEQDRTARRTGTSASGRPAVLSATEPAPPVTPAPSGAATPSAAVKRPPGVTAEEIRLFFPGLKIERSRLISVGDRIVEEARLFPEGNGVVMTIVVRRPVFYFVSRTPGALQVHVETGVLLAAAPSEVPGAAAPEPAAPRPGPRPFPDRGKSPLDHRKGVEGQLVEPKVEIPKLKSGEGLTVDAENLSVDREKNEVVAKGHVTIARASSLLTADEVRINRETQVAEARGNVELTDLQGSIQADALSGNLEDETGELTNGSINLTSTQMTVTGSRLQKSYGQTYHIEDGTFTTCQCGAGAPSWSIAGSDIDVTLDGYGFVRNARFRVLDVPVLYLPWAAFPAKTTRQSGFLAPQFGYSNKRGFEYLQPFYIAINKSADATLAGDVETEARVGGLAEYRYALDKVSRGVVNFSFFNESLRTNANRDIVNPNVADPDIPEDRWSETASIEQELPFGIRAFADSLAVSDDFFLREIPTFSFDPAHQQTLRTSRFDVSRAGLVRSWDHVTIITEAKYFQDFIQEDDLTLQRLPQATLFASDRFLDRHLKLGLNAEFVNFARREGFDGQRGDIVPRAEVPFRFQEFLRGTLGMQFRETAYHQDNTDLILPLSQSGGVQDPAALGLEPLSENANREIYQADASITTEIARVFEVDGEDVAKIKHTIEPGVDYRFVPDVEQADLPTYDFVDRIERRNQFTYGFTSRLLARLANAPTRSDVGHPPGVAELNSFHGVSASPFDDESTRGGLRALGAPERETEDAESSLRPGEVPPALEGETAEQRAARVVEERSAISHVVEWARLQIFQSYDLDESLRAERNDHFSDVDTILRLTPSRLFSLRYESSVDAREQRLTAALVGLTLRDPRPRSAEGLLQSGERAALGVAYRFINDNVLEEIDGGLSVPLADTLSVFYLSRYDSLAKKFLENTGGFRLYSQCRCWILDVSVSDRVNPDETEVRAQLTLVGLGSIGRSR